jgi:hypothetical protein
MIVEGTLLLEYTTINPFFQKVDPRSQSRYRSFPSLLQAVFPEGLAAPMAGLRCADVVRFSGRSANYTIESCTFRSRSKVCGQGKTAVWSREHPKALLDSIPKDSVSGLRDLLLIAAMFYSFARVSVVLKLEVDDYYHNGARPHSVFCDLACLIKIRLNPIR